MFDHYNNRGVVTDKGDGQNPFGVLALTSQRQWPSVNSCFDDVGSSDNMSCKIPATSDWQAGL